MMTAAATEHSTEKSPHLQLLRPDEAARLLGVSPGSLAVWRSTKRYPLRFVRVGRHVRYRMSDIAAFLELRTEPGDGGSSKRRRRAR